jgi:hypothetical protein
VAEARRAGVVTGDGVTDDVEDEHTEHHPSDPLASREHAQHRGQPDTVK